MEDDHVEESITRRKELLHNYLQQILAFGATLGQSKRDVEFLEHRPYAFLVGTQNSLEYSEYRIKNESVKGALERFPLGVRALGHPFSGSRIEEVVAPQTFHHFVLVDTELLGVAVGEWMESESPAMHHTSSQIIWKISFGACIIKIVY
jgi:hypothetical protein